MFQLVPHMLVTILAFPYCAWTAAVVGVDVARGREEVTALTPRDVVTEGDNPLSAEDGAENNAPLRGDLVGSASVQPSSLKDVGRSLDGNSWYGGSFWGSPPEEEPLPIVAPDRRRRSRRRRCTSESRRRSCDMNYPNCAQDTDSCMPCDHDGSCCSVSSAPSHRRRWCGAPCDPNCDPNTSDGSCMPCPCDPNCDPNSGDSCFPCPCDPNCDPNSGDSCMPCPCDPECECGASGGSSNCRNPDSGKSCDPCPCDPDCSCSTSDGRSTCFDPYTAKMCMPCPVSGKGKGGKGKGKGGSYYYTSSYYTNSYDYYGEDNYYYDPYYGHWPKGSNGGPMHRRRRSGDGHGSSPYPSPYPGPSYWRGAASRNEVVDSAAVLPVTRSRDASQGVQVSANGLLSTLSK